MNVKVFESKLINKIEKQNLIVKSMSNTIQRDFFLIF